VAEETLGLLPSSDLQEFVVDALPLTRGMLEKMKELSHLRLRNQSYQDIKLAFDLLSVGNQGTSTKSTRRASNHTRMDKPDQHSVPKLESLTLSLIRLCSLERRLLDVVKERHNYNPGLKKLVVRSCWVHQDEDEPHKFREFVNEVEWDNVALGDEEDSGEDDDEVGGDQDLDDDEPGDSDADDVCERFTNTRPLVDYAVQM